MDTTSAAPHTPETPPASPGRDSRGRFTKGNPGGVGNPFARQVAALRSAFLQRVGPDGLGAIADALVAKAAQGDVAAAKLVLAYSLGKPAPAVDPDRLDMEEWQQFCEQSHMVKDVTNLIQTPTPEYPLHVVRTMRPAIDDVLHQETAKLVAELEAERAAPQGQESTVVDTPPSPHGANGAAAPAPSPHGVDGDDGLDEPSPLGSDGDDEEPDAPHASWLDEVRDTLEPALWAFCRQHFGPPLPPPPAAPRA